MAKKYHVNDSGEPGLCKAEKHCPFGGDNQHYADKELARKAYELSMGYQMTKAEVNPGKKEKAKKVNVKYEGLVSNFNKTAWDGYSIEDLQFDENAERERLIKKYSDSIDVESELKIRRESWANRARTAPAKNNEIKVPVRLIPTGSTISFTYRGRRYERSVGLPTILNDNSVVGKYKDIANQWDYIDGDTTLNVLRVPKNKSVSKIWDKENEEAANLQKLRLHWNQC